MRLKQPFFAALLATAAASAFAATQHFSVSAAFVAPASKGADASVAVTFTALDPDVHINEAPGPRLKLDATQAVLVDKQKPAGGQTESFDPDKAKYLDLAAPVVFPVALSPSAPKGAQSVPVNVTYFYCSKREGWCRKGTADLSLSVTVP
jgi:hypothetical protein